MSSELNYIAFMKGPEEQGQMCEYDFTQDYYGCVPEGARSDNGGMLSFDRRKDCEAAIKEILSDPDCPYTAGTVISQRVTITERTLKTIYKK